MARSVSAVAVPVGNASPSRLMSWRLMGMAAKTPSAAMAANQPIIGTQSGRTVVTIMSAPKAAMLPPPVMYPAPEPTVVSALFSSAVSGRRTRPVACRPRKSAKARMAAVMVTPIDQPGLEEDVEVRQAHHRADDHPDHHGAGRELGRVRLVGVLEPALLRIRRRGLRVAQGACSGIVCG